MEGLLLKFKRELEIRNFSRKTIKSYMHVIKSFLKYARKGGLNENTSREYMLFILKRKNPSTASHNLSVISFFFEKVLFQKINIPHPKRNKPIPEVLTQEEVKKLISVIKNPKHNIIIRLIYGCGLRVGEVIDLKKRDFLFSEGLIHIKMAKGRKDRFVKIPESLIHELRSY